MADARAAGSPGPVPFLTAQEADLLRRWDASPLVTDAQARYLVGVLRAAVLALAAPEPDKPLAGDAQATAEWSAWHGRWLAGFTLAREIG